jgi:hypothetical protein
VSTRDLERLSRKQKALAKKAKRHGGSENLDPRDRRELERIGGRMAKQLHQEVVEDDGEDW